MDQKHGCNSANIWMSDNDFDIDACDGVVLVQHCNISSCFYCTQTQQQQQQDEC